MEFPERIIGKFKSIIDLSLYFCLQTTERAASPTITGGTATADGLILNHITLDFLRNTISRNIKLP